MISKCHISNSAIECQKNVIRRSVCRELPLYKKDGKQYCVLHLPDFRKHEVHDFVEIFKQRLEVQLLDFQFVFFSDFINLSDFVFTKSCNFSNATFIANLNFENVTFKKTVDFRWAKFCQEFSSQRTIFEGSVLFDNGSFSKNFDLTLSSFAGLANFNSLFVQGDVILHQAKFENDAIFHFRNCEILGIWKIERCIFKCPFVFKDNDKDSTFADLELWLKIQNAFYDPSQVIFKNLHLRPSWFADVDCNQITFRDIVWVFSEGGKKSAQFELEKVKKRLSISRPKRVLAITCRQLATKYEDELDFEQASKFRKMAMQITYIEKKEAFLEFLNPDSKIDKREISIIESFDPIHYFYRFLSFYGESWGQAALLLLTIIFLIFPYIYTQNNFQTCSKDRPIAASLTICESKDEEIRKNCTCSTDQITFTDAIVQSLTTATLQNVEYRKPLTVWGEIWIILEKIFAPLQAALLALAIRRKFMR